MKISHEHLCAVCNQPWTHWIDVESIRNINDILVTCLTDCTRCRAKRTGAPAPLIEIAPNEWR